MNIVKFFLFLTLVCQAVFAGSQAVKVSDLANCREVDFKVEAGQVILNDKSTPGQHLYLIHNISHYTLWVDHPNKKRSAAAGWASRIDQDSWSALAVKKHAFPLVCVEIKPGSEQFVPCDQSVTICKLIDTKFEKHALGTYWVAETKPLEEVLHTIRSRGIDLGR